MPPRRYQAHRTAMNLNAVRAMHRSTGGDALVAPMVSLQQDPACKSDCICCPLSDDMQSRRFPPPQLASVIPSGVTTQSPCACDEKHVPY